MNDIGPKASATVQTLGSITPQGGVADQDVTREAPYAGVQQAIESGPSAMDERNRWRGQVDALTSQHAHFQDGVAQPLEVRQRGMHL